MTNVSRPIPRDGRLISLILASKGIQDADERVLQQLMDFSYRYTADVLQNAQALSDHASRPGPGKIEKDDVELAIMMRKRYEFFEAPPRDYLASLAHELNSHPLPVLPESFEVVRLPPAHQRLAEVNFDIVPDPQLVLAPEEEEEEDESSDEEEDAVDGEGARANGGKGDEDAEEDEDEDMEEVGVDEGTAAAPAPPPAQEREMDEDYDV
ncbi:transcription initiation factor IID, 31kD subunit-domain-containing protein [Dioszegia hungarica]|uniref:Transcription initiation factor IID, 31kD subunit-domain-containing protein n=1 Tax=Dioszegia hungarica TaxID=4972 RepID=A0AA38LVU7_9TREE|nr:transcription initiation factor IID, 31kD subunit-domain-containing protein [Dioszegia hungarica]KAI9635821.1 transcription initiation factor IID, 31kD subunit-domain-containing protein [Dioszegia hungarica]